MVSSLQRQIAFREFLEKLGLKAAKLHPLEKSYIHTQGEFGHPDQMIMSAAALKDFMKAFGGPGK